MKTLLLLMTFSMIVFGCSGKIYTVQSPTFNEKETEGVLFYGYKVVKKPIVLDRIRNPKTGEISHSMYEPKGSAKYCAPNVKYIDVVVADFDTQYAIKYEPGWFETNKFSVELDNGMLKSVNSESTPGVKTAVESLQGIVDIGEDILKNFKEESISIDQQIFRNFDGQLKIGVPIKCSTEK